MTNTAEQGHLKRLYNIVDWIDLGLVGLIIFYYARLMSQLQPDLPAALDMDYGQILRFLAEHATLTGVALLVASLAVCVTFIYLTIRMRRTRQIGIVRAAARIIWNGMWIPLDLYFLFLIFFA